MRRPRTGIVNSLFGDGAAAAVLTSYAENGTGSLLSRPAPCVIDFESFCIPEQWAAMRFDWNDDAGRWSFYLDRDIPYVIGFNIREPLERLLRGMAWISPPSSTGCCTPAAVR